MRSRVSLLESMEDSEPNLAETAGYEDCGIVERHDTFFQHRRYFLLFY
jgi:hypothetical protein